MSSELSVKMAGWLGHVRAASEQGLTIAAYANAQGLSAAALYQAKSVLMKCGTWPRTTQRSSSNKLRAKASAFVPVRVASTRSCRLSHVSGWSIELDDLPSAHWLTDVVRGAAHVAS